MNGGYTQIDIVQLKYKNTNNNGIDDEIWLLQNTTAIYWVEVGYWAVAAPGGTLFQYFWGDQTYQHGIMDHALSSVPAPDIGQAGAFQIALAGSSGVYWQISTPYFFQQGYSSPNTMLPNNITIGQELSGTDGASAPTAHFRQNQWEGSDGIWHYQTHDGSLNPPQPPVNRQWYTRPTNSSTGGDLYTWCGC